MSDRRWFTRSGDVLLLKLRDEIRAIVPDVEGPAWRSSTNEVGVDFFSEPSPAVLTQVQTVITAHDPTDYEAQAKTTDYADLLAMAESALTQIASDLGVVASDLTVNSADATALVAASTLAAVKPIVNNMLTRQDHLLIGIQRILNRQDKIIRVLRHVVKS